MTVHPIVRSGLILGLFAVLGVSAVALIHQSTAERIAANEREVLLHRLHEVIPDSAYDNDLATEIVPLQAPELGSEKPLTAYLGWKHGIPVGAVLTVVAPDGYSGPITLLVGIYADGTLAGVRVIAHRETPGLGDKIDKRHSDWILKFQGLGLGHPPLTRWKVRHDGGDFDQFTGATISPRAVVGAVRRALVYFNSHRDALFTGARSNGGTAPETPEEIR